MVLATLDLVRWQLGSAQLELWQARRGRRAFAEACFSSVVLPISLRYMPLPVARVRTFGYLVVWPSSERAERFRRSPLARRWEGAAHHLCLELAPIQGFGAWGGEQPLAGWRADAPRGPVLLVTHSRTRPAALGRFARRSGRVSAALSGQGGCLWADGFLDGPRTLDTGTFSLWEKEADALRFAYGDGVHRDAIAAQRKGDWFSESWFGRFGVRAAAGSWPGLDLDLLSTAPNG
jgi:hypothetical protein